MNNHFEHPSSAKPLTHLRGFTLIELMITMVIIGILTSVGWSAYERQSTKNRRAEGVRALMEASSLMEKCYVNNFNVDNVHTYAGCNIPATSERGHYAIDDTVANTVAFTLTATAQNAQAGDAECTSLTITHLGVRSNTPDPANARRCWGE